MPIPSLPSLPALHHLQALEHWHVLEFVSDIHLCESAPQTWQVWQRYWQQCTADAVFLLGDIFEVWVGDDCAAPGSFEAAGLEVLRQASAQRPVYFMHGNRDFLFGSQAAQQAGVSLLPDPTVLHFQGHAWLLSHGDALCLADTAYQQFRAQVRDPAYQRALLQQPLAQRQALARTMREQSRMHQQQQDFALGDVDADACRAWLHQGKAATLIHGHTHRPASHDLGQGLRREVLSDWEGDHPNAHSHRAQVLELSTQGVRRYDLT